MQDIMEMIKVTELPVPAVEMVVLLIALTVCLLFKLSRVGLFTAYLFVYRWGWIVCLKNFTGRYHGALIVYFVFGSLVAIFTIVSMIRSSLER